MPDLADGETAEIQGSGASPYELKNMGGVYSCTCPAWRHQSLPIEKRTCKHLRAYRGNDAEEQRIGVELPAAWRSSSKKATKTGVASDVPGLLLAHSWKNDVDITNWWMSEKLDGVRAYWDGETFYSRQGNQYLAPDWFVKALPKEPLDGELWVGRAEFQRTVSIVRRQDKSDEWKKVTYLVFDAPDLKKPFEERIQHLSKLFAENPNPYARLLLQEVCRDSKHLKRELERVEKLGGEGLMMRKPGSSYVAGRSSTLLKVKTFHDAEARVLDHLPGTGKHKGRLGALASELEDGTKFSIGTGFSDAEREAPPPVGSIVTFRYQELTKAGVPRFPSFLRVRTDYTWKGSSKSPHPKKPAPVATPKKAVPKAAGKPKASSAPASTSTAKRRLEFSDGKSNKFWEVEVKGTEVWVWFGRIGTDGQNRIKNFDDEQAASRHADKEATKKLNKGYEEITS